MYKHQPVVLPEIPKDCRDVCDVRKENHGRALQRGSQSTYRTACLPMGVFRDSAEKGSLNLGSRTCTLWGFLYFLRRLVLDPVTRQGVKLDTLLLLDF